MMTEQSVLLIEPFATGSHKQFMDLLAQDVPGCELICMPGKKWQWRARTSALYLSQTIAQKHRYRVLFASSVLNLAELIAVRPDLAPLHKVLYFHENQLVYPVRRHLTRDFQFGYNQIVSCLAADVVVFNSIYNMTSFLDSIASFLKLIPDHRPRNIADQIRPKCRVLYFPLNLSKLDDIPGNIRGPITMDTVDNEVTDTNHTTELTNEVTDTKEITDYRELTHMEMTDTKDITGHIKEITDVQTVRKSEDVICVTSDESSMNRDSVSGPSKGMDADGVTGGDGRPLHIVWPHRWEHDKGPDSFFNVMYRLQEAGCDFRLSVLGEQYSDVPAIFDEARKRLSERILHWGYQETRSGYRDALRQADCVVSTADHEFFGVAMLEAVYCSCYPLCPKRLVYPEIFPGDCLYNTDNQLYKRLKSFCGRPDIPRRQGQKLKDIALRYSWETLKPEYMELLAPS